MVGAGYDLKMSNPGFSLQSGGNDGLTIRGRMAVALWNLHTVISPTNTFFIPFNTTFDAANGNALHLNPITLFPTSSREFSVAYGFAEFRFTRLRVEIQSTTATSIQASGAVCYTADGAITGSAFDSSAEIFAYPNSVAMPAWGSREMDVSSSLVKNSWYYIDMGSTSGVSNDADYRQAFQGVIGGYTIGFAPISGGAEYVAGVVYLTYELELRGPRITGDLVLRGTDHSLKRAMHDKDRKIRALKEAARIKYERKSEMKDDSDGDIEHIASTPSRSVPVEQPSPFEPIRAPSVRPSGLVVAGSKTTKAEK
jgi:hypothetical protein